jgi:hypothetical protein
MHYEPTPQGTGDEQGEGRVEVPQPPQGYSPCLTQFCGRLRCSANFDAERSSGGVEKLFPRFPPLIPVRPRLAALGRLLLLVTERAFGGSLDLCH